MVRPMEAASRRTETWTDASAAVNAAVCLRTTSSSSSHEIQQKTVVDATKQLICIHVVVSGFFQD